MNRKLLLLIALLACFALPLGHLAAQDATPAAADASLLPYGEPNDTVATATPATGYRVNGYLTATDLDFYRWTAARPENLLVEFYPYGQPAPLRIELALFDAGQSLLQQDTTCDDSPARMEALVPPGDYYVRVEACPGPVDQDQEYQVWLGGQATEWEPNNSRATASPLAHTGDAYFGDTVAGAISADSDVDFYGFQGEAGRMLNVDVWTEDHALWPQVSLLDSTGAVLSNGQTNCAGNSNTACLLYYTLPADGDYYLRIRSATHPNGAGDYRFWFSLEVQRVEVEPNDTPAQAFAAAIGSNLVGELGWDDAVDYYRFYGEAGDRVAFTEYEYSYEYQSVLTLYDPSMQPLALSGPSRFVALPATGEYTLRVQPPVGETDDEYYLFITPLPAGEPNDTWQTATPATIGQTITAAHDYLCDDDWYRFQGRKGDVFSFIDPPVQFADSPFAFLYDAGGNRLDGEVVLPADGTYYLKVLGDWWTDDDGDCLEGPHTFTLGESLWISAPVDGLGGDATIKRGDIVTRRTAAGKWQLVFDASDVGITADVTAIERLPNGTILMALGTAQNVPGLGKVMPQDIIRFVPTSLGSNTAGAFQWFLDGSDVGLTTTGEKIDAISYQRNVQYPLRISITGAGSVPRVSGGALAVADEDIITFVQTQWGANTAGAWRMNLDGSTVPGLAVEDINALSRVPMYPERTSPELMVLFDSFRISGVSGGPKDVFDMQNGIWVKDLADKKIDALTVGAALP